MTHLAHRIFLGTLTLYYSAYTAIVIYIVLGTFTDVYIDNPSVSGQINKTIGEGIVSLLGNNWQNIFSKELWRVINFNTHQTHSNHSNC